MTPDAFMARVRAVQGGCWKWLGPVKSVKPDRSVLYGQLKLAGRTVQAHRLAYELFVGPIPAGLQIDHLCRNTRCVNPAHLEPVTPRVNILRGVGTAAVNECKTHCIRGHEFTPENTEIQRVDYGKGFKRSCKTCRRAAVTARKAAS